jgi:hypothetical protein
MNFHGILLSLFVSLLFAGVGASSLPALECSAVDGVDVVLQPGNIVLLGEIHGTKESPRAVTNLTCAALERDLAVTVGLEIPQSENKRIQKYLNSAGTAWDQVQMLEGDFWQRDYQDGRGSGAMLDLIETLRAFRQHGQDIQVLLIDNSMVPDRDRFMAQWLHGAIAEEPERFFLALTGNMHNRLMAFSSDRAPMGFHLRHLLPEANVVSLEITYTGGTAWVCTSDGCGIRKLGGHSSSLAGIQLFEGPTDEGFSGSYEVGDIAASPPAKRR